MVKSVLGKTCDRVLKVMRECPTGGWDYAELMAELGTTYLTITSTILRNRKKYGSKYFYILRYRSTRGRGGLPQPVYAPGPGKDAPRPVIDSVQAQKEAQLRSRNKLKALRAAREKGKPAHPFAGLGVH